METGKEEGGKTRPRMMTGESKHITGAARVPSLNGESHERTSDWLRKKRKSSGKSTA